MLIDLHCHTKKTKTGDAATRNVDVDKFKEKIIESNVKIVAITNHNHFDYAQYSKFKDAVKDYCEVWPGIELDIKGKNNRGHLIVIANPKNAIMFDKIVNNELIKKQNPNDCLFDLKVVYEKIDECDVVYIPHFHKEPKLCEDDIEELNSLLKDKSRLFKETSDYRSLGVFANYDYSVIIGSDVQDWNNYEKSTFADLRLNVSGYKQFCLLAKRDKLVINTLLNKKSAEEFTVSPYKNVFFKLHIYKDINIIFGQKGTGKSEILKSLKSAYSKRSIACNSYAGSDKEQDFSKLLKCDDLSRKIEVLGGEDCTDVFKFIQDWEDKLPVQIKTFIDWYNTRENNKNKKKMKITEASALPYKDTKELNRSKKDYQKVSGNIIKDIKALDLDKYIPADKEEFLRILNLLQDNIYDDWVSKWNEIESIKLANKSLEIIKSVADRSSDTVSKPSTTGFEAFAINRLQLKENMDKILHNLNLKQNNKLEKIGTLEEKGDIYIQTKYRMLSKESETNEFKVGIRKLKEIQKMLVQIDESYYKNNLSELIANFIALVDDAGVKNMNSFVGISKCVVTNEDEPYSPSNGECGILLLQRLLEEKNDVYILDEPELGMGNSYINNIILPKLINLAKQRKTVIVATHNANIAVRTLPYMSIYRTHENGVYSTYEGNPFSDELINIEDESDIKNWTKESMHTLEGGKNAFYERKDIYESGSTNN